MPLTIRFFALVTPLLSAAVAEGAPPELNGFPATVGRGNAVKGLIVVDLDGNGKPSIIVAAGETLVAFSADGQVRPGFAYNLRQPTDETPVMLSAGPAACDLNGDGRQEIVIAGSSRKLYAVSASGTPVSGFPVQLEGNPRGTVSCLPAGKRFDVVLTTDAGNLVVVPGSGGAPRTLARIGRGAESGVAVADLDGDGDDEIIAGGGDSKLYVVDKRGQVRAGFPYPMTFRTSGVPAVGDIDDDGELDLVFGSQDFKIHAVTKDGKALAGFPVATGYRVYAGAALADLDGDGILDLVVGSGDKMLYAMNGRGQALKSFPLQTEGRIELDSVVGDVDRDGKQEILTIVEDGTLLLVRGDGSRTRIGVKGAVVAGPVLADLDGDKLPELLVATNDFAVHTLKLEASGPAEEAIVAWAALGHDARHSGRFAPNPARLKNLALTKARPKTTDPLRVQYRFFDLDREPERDTQIRWYCDGKHVPDLDNQREVPAERTTKHQKWYYTLQESANMKAYGERGVLTRIFAMSPVEIENTSPAAPAIQLTPEDPFTTSDLQVAVVKPSVDPDGDAIEYRYAWLRDGSVAPLKRHETVVAASTTRKNEEWRVVVVPFDGEVEGASSSAAVRVRNTAPGKPEIAVAPREPRIADRMDVRIARPAPDDDQDAITYTYRYWVNGKPLRLGAASPTIDPQVLRKHDKMRVEVTAHDDEEPGGRVEAELVVLNTPPPPPAIGIWPAEPRTRDDLLLAVNTQRPDADGDPIILRHQWSVDGVKVDLPVLVPKSETRKGQLWKIEVIPFDGEVVGAPVVAESRILNTAPTPPVVELDRYTFSTDAEIAPRIVSPAQDDDGDTVRLKYRWSRDGRSAKLPETTTSLSPENTNKNQVWDLEVVPHDGETDGTPVRLRFEIKNSPPTAPKIAFSNERPTVRDRVTVSITNTSTDKDADKLSYRYRWYREGKQVAGWPLDKAALEPGDARKGQHWRVEVRAFDGESEGEPAKAELLVINHVPSAPNLALQPAQPKVTDDLACEVAVASVDPDGDTLSYRTRWMLDGKPLPISSDASRLPSTLTRKKQSWMCEVTASDGELVSSSVRSAAVTIRNTPPPSPVVSVVPAKPTTEQDLVCQIDKPSVDLDLDLVAYSFAWKVDGKPYRTESEEPNHVPARATKRGQLWECAVTPNDGEVDGQPAVARAEIQNSTPTPPRVRIAPERPVAGRDLSCEIVEVASDLDNDLVRYQYVWSRDGVVQSFSPASTSVPGRLVKPKDIWKCEVTPADGLTSGDPGRSADVLVGASAN